MIFKPSFQLSVVFHLPLRILYSNFKLHKVKLFIKYTNTVHDIGYIPSCPQYDGDASINGVKRVETVIMWGEMQEYNEKEEIRNIMLQHEVSDEGLIILTFRIHICNLMKLGRHSRIRRISQTNYIMQSLIVNLLL